jgi:hypothetical protein
MSTTPSLPERDNQQKQTAAEPMTKVTERTIAFVIDASSGIGEAVAQRLAAKGITTYAGARRLDRMEHLKQSGVRILRLDPNGTLQPQVTTRVRETI